MIDFNELPSLIVQNRKAQGFTQAQLATKAGVSKDLIASFESGRLTDLSAKRLLRILHALNLDLRITTLSKGRPTLDDLLAEEEGNPE